MAIRYHIDTLLNCVFIQHLDDLVHGEFKKHLQQILDDSKFQLGMNFLHDASNISFVENPTTKSIGAKRDRLKKFDDPEIGTCRIAWVVATAIDYGIMHRISVTNRFNPEVERRPFRDSEKARTWIEIPEDYEINYGN